MRDKLINYMRAGYPGIYLVSHEEQRVEAEFKAAATTLGRRLYAWSATDGIVDTADGSVRQAGEPLEAVTAVRELPESSVLLLRDFHLFLQDSNPVLIRALKDELAEAKARGKTLVILGCRQALPPELEREFVSLDFNLPDKTVLGDVLDGIVQSAKLARVEGDARDLALDAACGMTCAEAENAFALSVVETRGIDPRVVAREKAQTVRKNGLLEVVEGAETLDDIGGLNGLKTWLGARAGAFGDKARQYGLPMPKGLLIVGIPGTGKSLTAKATAALFGRPLLRLDTGRLYGSLVGQSEANLRSAIHIAEAIAPCVLWLEELDKGFASSSGSTDGGTSSRVLGSFLTWMQEKRSAVFIVATANDVSRLPAELLRRGRWDETFFIDLPGREERRSIWAVQIRRYGRDPKAFDTAALAHATENWTGAEIEQAVIDGLYRAFGQDRELNASDLAQAISETVPLSRLMEERIAQLRKWAQGRCRPADTGAKRETGRRIAA